MTNEEIARFFNTTRPFIQGNPNLRYPQAEGWFGFAGVTGFYYQDWVVVQETDEGDVNWIIETKGRVWEDTSAKDDAMKVWRTRVSETTGADWRYIRINQKDADLQNSACLAELTDAL
jgi:hypothetical protein